MRLTAELTSEPNEEGRRAARASVKVSAGYREGHARCNVDIVDLSPTGAKVESHLRLQPNTVIWLKLPGVEAWQARVAWVDKFQAGCEFVRPLHPAVFDRVVASCRSSRVA